MRTAEEWDRDYLEHVDWLESQRLAFIRAVQMEAKAAGFSAGLEAAAKVVAPMGADSMRLMGGEMTAQEVRTVQAFMAAAERGIHALSPQRGEDGD